MAKKNTINLVSALLDRLSFVLLGALLIIGIEGVTNYDSHILSLLNTTTIAIAILLSFVRAFVDVKRKWLSPPRLPKLK